MCNVVAHLALVFPPDSELDGRNRKAKSEEMVRLGKIFQFFLTSRIVSIVFLTSYWHLMYNISVALTTSYSPLSQCHLTLRLLTRPPRWYLENQTLCEEANGFRIQICHELCFWC